MIVILRQRVGLGGLEHGMAGGHVLVHFVDHSLEAGRIGGILGLKGSAKSREALSDGIDDLLVPAGHEGLGGRVPDAHLGICRMKGRGRGKQGKKHRQGLAAGAL